MIAVSQDSCDNQWPQHLDRAIAFTPQSRAQPVPKACISAETVADCSVPSASALFADCVSEEPVAVKNFSPGASAGPSCRSVTDFDFQCEFCAVPLAFSRIVISSAGQPPPFRTCRLCQPQAASAASCAGHVQVESAIGLAMPATVGGWFLDCSEVGLGSGAGSWDHLLKNFVACAALCPYRSDLQGRDLFFLRCASIAFRSKLLATGRHEGWSLIPMCRQVNLCTKFWSSDSVLCWPAPGWFRNLRASCLR